MDNNYINFVYNQIKIYYHKKVKEVLKDKILMDKK
jgi:hypothetical protein